MVAAQPHAETEGVMESEKLEERCGTNFNRHPLNKPDEDSARECLTDRTVVVSMLKFVLLYCYDWEIVDSCPGR